MGACASIVSSCCEAAICPPPALCLDGEPYQLQSLDNSGVWTGYGVSESGLFNPNFTGVGNFSIIHNLACGSEITEIRVNNCAPIEICLGEDTTYWVTAGQEPFSWQYYVQGDTIQITNQQQCEACGYYWFSDNCLDGFFLVDSCIIPDVWIEFASGDMVSTLDSFPIRVINSIGIEKIIYSSDEVLPCTNCSDLAVSFAPDNTSFCNAFGGVILQGGSPAGGIYSGTAVIDNVFYPSLAGNGLHPITYYYSNELGCADSATIVFEVDNCTGTEFIENTLLTIAPNPLHDLTSLTIQSHVEAELYTAELYDLSGRSMLATKIYINDQATLVLPIIARGVYTLILRSEKRTFIKSLVKI
jgi:hypothetical protein